jgi:hypothetical protein
MQRSIAAKYAAHPVARFVTPPRRARERRLGLIRHPGFHAATERPTVLRRSDPGPIALLRADWRAVAPARSHRPVSGLPRTSAPVRWAKLGIGGAGRRPRAASAPWRA